MSHTAGSRQSHIEDLAERDTAASAEQHDEYKRLVQEALETHADLQRAKKAHAEACARLIPFRQQLTQVAA